MNSTISWCIQIHYIWSDTWSSFFLFISRISLIKSYQLILHSIIQNITRQDYARYARAKFMRRVCNCPWLPPCYCRIVSAIAPRNRSFGYSCQVICMTSWVRNARRLNACPRLYRKMYIWHFRVPLRVVICIIYYCLNTPARACRSHTFTAEHRQRRRPGNLSPVGLGRNGTVDVPTSPRLQHYTPQQWHTRRWQLLDVASEWWSRVTERTAYVTEQLDSV